MAVPVASLATTPYNIGAPQVLVNVAPLRGEHKIYTTGNARITDAWTPNNMGAQMRDFAGTVNAGGNTIYLPYNDDHITSGRLPVPPPGGVNFFLTANMSGCKFFVDTINGSNDLMVYHANTHQHAAPRAQCSCKLSRPQCYDSAQHAAPSRSGRLRRLGVKQCGLFGQTRLLSASGFARAAES